MGVLFIIQWRVERQNESQFSYEVVLFTCVLCECKYVGNILFERRSRRRRKKEKSKGLKFLHVLRVSSSSLVKAKFQETEYTFIFLKITTPSLVKTGSLTLMGKLLKRNTNTENVENATSENEYILILMDYYILKCHSNVGKLLFRTVFA